MANNTRYQVSIHFYGRKMIRRGPCEGLLEWPNHKWVTVNRRPLGLRSAIALADSQGQHAVVNVWMDAEKVHDNGKAPAVPEGWYPADAQTAQAVA